MSMSRIVIAVVAAVGCGKSDAPALETHYFGERVELRNRIGRECTRVPGMGMIDRRHQWDESLPRDYMEIDQFRCSLQVSDGRVTGLLPFTLQGSPAWKGGRGACAIRIGPAPTNAPLPLDRVLTWFDDRAVADAIRQAVGPVNYEDTYEIAVTVAGFHVRLQQFHSPVDGLHLELSIDGCSRLPDTKQVRIIGGPKLFLPQTQ
jgi:hypothetical protein